MKRLLIRAVVGSGAVVSCDQPAAHASDMQANNGITGAVDFGDVGTAGALQTKCTRFA